MNYFKKERSAANTSNTNSSHSGGAILTRPRSQSTRSSNSTNGTRTIDSSHKITLTEPLIQKDTWSADTQTALLNLDEYKAAKHWKELKNDLKKYVAKMKSDAISKKFEIDIKIIGR